MIKLVECPRDAMQGIAHPIATELKIRYLNQLLRVGFDTLDFGSFVSPRAVPQMADTAAVVEGLELNGTTTKLLAIIANLRGAQDACQFEQIHYLGYPFSLSETFQQRNTRKSIGESLLLVDQLQELCQQKGKELLLYFSMGFGNPYGDHWDVGVVEQWTEQMVQRDIRILSLADTVGTADPVRIGEVFSSLLPRFPQVEWSAHFHAHPTERRAKLQAAWENGCRRFETALMGFGGCPFAEDELVGNIATESLLAFCEESKIPTSIDRSALQLAQLTAQQVFLNPA